jgi:hypothetical protein
VTGKNRRPLEANGVAVTDARVWSVKKPQRAHILTSAEMDEFVAGQA